MTSVGGRKQRFCTPKYRTNQLGGEIPTPPYILLIRKIQKSRSSPKFKKSEIPVFRFLRFF